MISPSGNWSGPPDNASISTSDDDSVDVIDSAEVEETLVTKDFSDLSMNSVKDVATAIEMCKKSVMESVESTEERKELVHKLIQLRIRYQDLMAQMNAKHGGMHEGLWETRGHQFVHYHDAKIPGVTNAKKIYCQQCRYSIWIYLQSSLHCRSCGFSVHVACAGEIMRQCVAEKVQTKPDFILDICPEKSLRALRYRCVECDQKLSSQDPAGEPRLCDYTGLSFCPSCHWNTRALTPARILHNWDFTTHPVSQATKQYLFLMYQKPVINVEKVNPKLFAVEQDMVQVKRMRMDIMLMKKYLVVCRIASEQKLLLHLADRQHFVDDSEHYSLKDLVDIHSGVMFEYLNGKLEIFSNHIKNCVLCTAKGFICEICDAKEKDLLFPFDPGCYICDVCQSVFHRDCRKIVASCPKCSRKTKMKEEKEKFNLDNKESAEEK